MVPCFTALSAASRQLLLALSSAVLSERIVLLAERARSNQSLQQIGHAKHGSSGLNASSRVSRLLSGAFGSMDAP